MAAAVLLHLDREDLARGPAFFDRLARLHMALVGELVQLLPAESPLLGDHLGGIALRDDLEQIHQLGADRTVTGPKRIRAHGHARHVLHAGADHNVLRTGHHALGSEVDGLLAGATEAIDRRPRNFDWKSRDQGGGAGDVHALLASLGDATRHDVVDLRRIDASTRHEFAQREGQEIIRPDRAERAASAADRRPDGFNDYGLAHETKLPVMMTYPAPTSLNPEFA